MRVALRQLGSLVVAISFGSVPLAAQVPFPLVVRVDSLDNRNFVRSGVLPEIRQLANIVEINCADLRDRLNGQMPTRETLAACLLPEALQEYERALTAVAGELPLELDTLELRLRSGVILDGRRTRVSAAQSAAHYFLAKAFLASALTATADLFNQWFPVWSTDFFRYILPQANSALSRGTQISPALAFLLHVNCNQRACGDARLAQELARAARPVAMIRIGDGAGLAKSDFLPRATLQLYEIVLRVEEALGRLRAAAADPRISARLIVEGEVDDPSVQQLRATVEDLEHQLAVAACWVSTPERRAALAWIDARAAIAATRGAPPSASHSATSPGTFLVGAGKETREASIAISNELVGLQATLSTASVRP